MPRDLAAYGVQFISRDCVPEELEGHYDDVPYEGAPFRLILRLQKGGMRVRPLVAHPWPRRPDFGARQHIDPYYDLRWPVYLHLHGNIRLIREDGLSEKELVRCCGEIRNVLFGSFKTMSVLSALADPRLSYESYRWRYFTGSTDLTGNPFPNPKGKYVSNYISAPAGPGFVNIPSIGAVSDLPYPSFVEVWSQGFSVPPGATEEDAERRAQEIKRHWNSYEELGDAERSSTVKNRVRSSASAVDAALRFYCSEWGISFPTGSVPFNEKIDRILQNANRPSYSTVVPDEATKLLHLYRARNSMHEGDCYFNDRTTGDRVIVDQTLAREFFYCAQKFVVWIDSLA